MIPWLTNLGTSFLGCLKDLVRMGKDDGDDDEESSIEVSLVWRRELQKHSCGEFSFAVIQANETIEDHSQVEVGSNAIFAGVYDGHGGYEASRFVRDKLFQHLIRIALNNRTITEETLRDAIFATEEGFLTLVDRTFSIKPEIATVGSCCLVGIIWNGTIHIANLGDSRAVIGSVGRCNKIIAEQLTREHNANREDIRQELRAAHPQDPQIVAINHGTWRVKGIIQVSRTIGDAFLKKPQFTMESSSSRFHLPEPITQPVLTAVPSLRSRVLKSSDRFLIFASDGLWEFLTNQQAVEIVHKNPRNGIARKLIKAAQKLAAKKRNMEYTELQRIMKGNRRIFHDDITVIVVFIDHALLAQHATVPQLSFKGFVDSAGPSEFTRIQEIM